MIVAAYVEKLTRALSPASVKQHLAALRMLLDWLYARVSTADQCCERQIAELTAFAERGGFEVLGFFKETASGASEIAGGIARFVRRITLRAGKALWWSCNLPAYFNFLVAAMPSRVHSKRCRRLMRARAYGVNHSFTDRG